MAEDGHSPDASEIGYGEAPAMPEQCVYGHKGWLFLRYGREIVCGRCGVRMVNVPGRRID